MKKQELIIVSSTSLAIPLKVAMSDYLNRFCANAHTKRAKGIDFDKFLTYMEYNHTPPYVYDLTPASIEGFIERRIKDGDSPATASRRLATIKHFCKILAQRFKDFIDPSIAIRGPRLGQRIPKWFTEAEWVRLREFAPKYGATLHDRRRNQLLLELGYYTGLRCSEITSLNLSHLSHDLSTLVNVRGKGNRYDNIALHPKLRELIRGYLPLRAEALGSPTPLKSLDQPLLISLRARHIGCRMNSKTVWRIINEIGKLAGTSHAHPHRLRHTFIKRIVDVTKDLNLARECARHSSVQTTCTYLTSSHDERLRAIEAMP